MSGSICGAPQIHRATVFAPAFAKHRDALGRALQGYKRINARAFEQIRPGGIVFTFSCSQVVSKDKFREAVFSAAAISGDVPLATLTKACSYSEVTHRA